MNGTKNKSEMKSKFRIQNVDIKLTYENIINSLKHYCA